MSQTLTAQGALDRLEHLYSRSVENLGAALSAYLETGRRPSAADRAEGLFAYPELRLSWRPGERPPEPPLRAFGRLARPGVYATTVTRPDLFRDYLLEQLTLLESDYGAAFEVAPSRQEIPFPYVLDRIDGGLDAARTVFTSAWAPEFSAPPKRALSNPKSVLQEWALGAGRALPVYRVADRSGPDHAPMFTVEVSVEGLAPLTARGRSRQEAEKAAATAMLEREGLL